MQQSKPLIPHGWLRALLFFIFFFVIAFLVQILMDKLFMKLLQRTLNDSLFFNISINLISVFLSVWIFRTFVDRQSVYSLGFAWKGFVKHAWTGFFAATTMLGIGTLILAAFKYLSFSYITFDIYSFTVNICLMTMVAFSEELLFRGYLLNNLMQSLNKWPALIISALLFSFVHISNPGSSDSILPMIEIFIGGIMLGINYIYTKNLWFGIFMHFAWNFFQGPILGYKVSGINIQSIMQQNISGPEILTGGAFGFEGSLVSIILNIIVVIILSIVYEKK